MKRNRFLGFHGRSSDAPQTSRDDAADFWAFDHGEHRLTFEVSGPHFSCFRFDRILVLLRGQAVLDDRTPPREVARAIHEHYLNHSDLPVERLEGSYTLILVDGGSGRTLLYRNLVGTGFTYYAKTPTGLVYGSNLAELVASADHSPRPNRQVLPAYFLYRFVPGRETLFADYLRLLPGEMLDFDGETLRRRQRQTFADLRGQALGDDAVERLDAQMQQIFVGVRRDFPDAANLLSGGVDSTYLQATWNRTGGGRTGEERSFSLSVAHARTEPDDEYARTAAAALVTRHTFVPVQGAYLHHLLDVVAGTGETPNHVQAAYFGTLARFMASQGHLAGICGEGADGLFGVGAATVVQYAEIIRRWFRARPLQRLGHAAARLVGKDGVADAFALATHLHDESWSEHPVNQVSAFTERDRVAACFGEGGLAEGLAHRRQLLDHYDVPATPLLRLHAAGFLGEAMDSASLWATLFNRAGGELLCPFLDSRLLRLVLGLETSVRFPFRRPKEVLRAALCRYVPRELAYRRKRGFGQPIMEWMSPGGQLAPLVERIGRHDFLPQEVFLGCKARPGWFLYSLLCYDVWHKIFIERIPPDAIADDMDSHRAPLISGVPS